MNKRNKNYDIKKRSQTPNASRYNTFKNKKNNYNKFFRVDTVSSAYSKKFDKFKRTSYDRTNKKYRLITDFDEKNNKNYWFNNNKRRESEDGFRSLNFRTSKYTQNTSNYSKILKKYISKLVQENSTS